MNSYEIWINKYHPHKLDDIICQQKYINLLSNLLNNKSLPNCIIYGLSGIGKTTIIKYILNKYYSKYYNSYILELNGSEDRGISVIRNKIMSFASSLNLFTCGLKLIVLDEIDLMTKDAQLGLKKLIDLYNTNCKFILICNNLSKIDDGLKSRCMLLKLNSIDQLSALKKLKYICKNESIQMSDNALQLIIQNSNGDLRKMINLLQSICSINTSKINIRSIENYLNNLNKIQFNNLKQTIKTQNLKIINSKIQNIIIDNNYSISNIIDLILELIKDINSDDPIVNNELSSIIIDLATLEKYSLNKTNEQLLISSFVSIIYKLKKYMK